MGAPLTRRGAAYALNLLPMKLYELPRLPLFHLPIGALMLWLLGQLAVLGPVARRRGAGGCDAIGVTHAVRHGLSGSGAGDNRRIHPWRKLR